MGRGRRRRRRPRTPNSATRRQPGRGTRRKLLTRPEAPPPVHPNPKETRVRSWLQLIRVTMLWRTLRPSRHPDPGERPRHRPHQTAASVREAVGPKALENNQLITKKYCTAPRKFQDSVNI